MSRETMTHLNTAVLIGCTDQRGTAWHYRADLQGDQPNHYPGFVPIADVERRVFNYTAETAAVYVALPASVHEATGLDEDGAPVKMVKVPGRQAIHHSATGHVFGIHSLAYATHQFTSLTAMVSTLLADTVGISSAGILKSGAIGWIEVSVPETIHLDGPGVDFRPNLLATTSHDGSLATTLKRTITNVVCDNTHGVAMREAGQTYRIKHSRYSALKVADARAALGVLDALADEFAAEVADLVATTVTDRQWSAFLDAYIPRPEAPGRGRTVAETKRDGLDSLWRHDNRVTPWQGTGWGVVQAVNTWVHHEGIVRGAGRAERNMLRACEGGADKLDADTVRLLTAVLT